MPAEVPGRCEQNLELTSSCQRLHPGTNLVGNSHGTATTSACGLEANNQSVAAGQIHRWDPARRQGCTIPPHRGAGHRERVNLQLHAQLAVRGLNPQPGDSYTRHVPRRGAGPTRSSIGPVNSMDPIRVTVGGGATKGYGATRRTRFGFRPARLPYARIREHDATSVQSPGVLEAQPRRPPCASHGSPRCVIVAQQLPASPTPDTTSGPQSARSRHSTVPRRWMRTHHHLRETSLLPCHLSKGTAVLSVMTGVRIVWDRRGCSDRPPRVSSGSACAGAVRAADATEEAGVTPDRFLYIPLLPAVALPRPS